MRLFLAPMQGVVDHHFRDLYSELGGIDACVSEFVRVNEVAVPRKTFLRECKELNYAGESQTPSGTTVRVQLLGSNPQTLAQSALTASKLGASAIDLNFGCPAKTVNNSRGGAILLDDTQLLYDIVRSVRQALPANINLSAKIRLGFEQRARYVENAQAIEAAGANELCVHARSRKDGYEPPAYWTCIGEIKQQVNIPVIANGEIWSVDDWQRCEAESGCDDFMLGRGLMAKPDLALAIRAAHQGTEHVSYRWLDALALLHRYYIETRDLYAQRFHGNRVKQWLYYLQFQYAEATPFFERIKRYRVQQEFDAAFADHGIFPEAVTGPDAIAASA